MPIIAYPSTDFKEELSMPTTTYGNNDRLTERLNRCHNPRAALAVLCVVLSAFKGNYDAVTPETIRAILEGQEKGGQTA